MSNYQKHFESIVAKHRLSLFKVAATFEADPIVQQDLLQDMLLAIWQALAFFRERSTLHTFIYRVAYNKALSHVAKESRTKSHAALFESVECRKSDIEAHIITLKSAEHVISKIRLLPIVQRQLITLSLEGFSYSDMAEISGLSKTNVGVQLNRAKTKLIQLMEKQQ
ncbi:RNA polymerase sigma factor [Agaribacter flavus]|uniref:RNA polymerase sigma factor n=1 Tax=Agaribacter flavus TaxID=1902781 RepID=A0ABV7FMA2_9ALTE